MHFFKGKSLQTYQQKKGIKFDPSKYTPEI